MSLLLIPSSYTSSLKDKRKVLDFIKSGRHGGGQAIYGGHGVHPAYEQRQSLPVHGVGPHEVRGRVEAEDPRGFVDALGRQVVLLAGRPVSIGKMTRAIPSESVKVTLLP